MIRVEHKGDYSKATQYLQKVQKPVRLEILQKYGQKGVQALASMTPVDTGKTAASWYFQAYSGGGKVTLTFNNSNIQNGVPIAIILYYGHGTRNGGWVEGRDYINPAIQPIFDEITSELWREVTNL